MTTSDHADTDTRPTITTDELRVRLGDPELDDRRRATARGVQRLAPQRRGPRRPHPRRRRVPERLAAQRRRGRDRAPPRREADHGRPRHRGLRRRPRRRPRSPRGSHALGIERVRVYEAGFGPGPRRPGSPGRPARQHYDKLVHIDWLRRVLAGERPEAAPTGKFLLFHVNFGVPEEYAEGHIPGALYLDTNWLEDPADWNRRSPEELEAALRALGHHQRHDRRGLRPRHRGRRQREVAGSPRRPDRGDAGVDDPALRGRRRRPAARRRLRLVGPRRQPARDRHPRAVAGRRLRRRRSRSGPRSSSTSRRPRRSSPTRTAPRSSASGRGASTSARSAATTTSARPAGSRATCGATAAPTPTTCSTTATSTTRCAPYPEITANWAEAGITRRQVGRVLLRDRLAGERDLVLRLAPGLAAHRGLRRRLVRVEPGPGQQPDRDRRARKHAVSPRDEYAA